MEDILVAVSAIRAGRVRAARNVRREAVEIDGIKDRSSAGMCGERGSETMGLTRVYGMRIDELGPGRRGKKQTHQIDI